jgi:hypothetical protein
MLESPDTPQELEDGGWRHAHETARALHDAFLSIGIPENELETMTARTDGTGTPIVYMPRLTPGSAHLLLDRLGPSLGPNGVHLARPRPVR